MILKFRHKHGLVLHPCISVAPDTLVLCDGGWGSEYTPGGSPSFNEYIEQWVPSWRHTLGANFLFMDGHAEWWSKAFLANGTTGNKYCTIAKD